TFSNSKAEIGGAVHARGASLNVSGCIFIQNTVSGVGAGGAVAMDVGAGATYADCTFVGNQSTNADRPSTGGGAVSCHSGSGPWRKCRFIENIAARLGSALWIDHGATGTVTNCTFAGNSFAGNSAQYGGALALSSGSNVAVANCAFASN